MGDDELRSTITDDALDRQLRDAMPYVDDAGFTARVLARLPVHRHARQAVRSLILIGLTLLGSGLAYIVSDNGRFIVVDLVRFGTLSPLSVISVAFAIGLLATGAAVVTAVAKLREAQA